MKQSARLLTICFFLLMSLGCSKKEPLPPLKIAQTNIELKVLKSIKSKHIPKNEVFRYEFGLDGLYKAYINNQLSHAGSYSYNLRSKKTARIVCAYSTTNRLAAYEILLIFETSNSGEWKSSYQHDVVEARSGTFKLYQTP